MMRSVLVVFTLIVLSIYSSANTHHGGIENNHGTANVFNVMGGSMKDVTTLASKQQTPKRVDDSSAVKPEPTYLISGTFHNSYLNTGGSQTFIQLGNRDDGNTRKQKNDARENNNRHRAREEENHSSGEQTELVARPPFV